MSKSRVWTGSKRVNELDFVDENGFTVDPLCNLKRSDIESEGSMYGGLAFPSEMTAEVNGTHIFWKNSIPSKNFRPFQKSTVDFRSRAECYGESVKSWSI